MTEAATIDAATAPARTPKRGRPKGSRNRTTAEIKSLAQKYGAKAIRGVYKIALNSGDDKKTELAAWRELLDRGFGKPVAPNELTGKDGAPLAVSLLDWMRGLPH